VTRKLPTVADLKTLKSKRQLTMLRYFSLDEAAAAEVAGFDIASVPPDICTHPRHRELAPGVFTMTGKTHLEHSAPSEYLKFYGEMQFSGVDAVYCSGSMKTVEHLANEFIPIVGDVGLVPMEPKELKRFMRGINKS
jgi:3-methyl-2-oxobutanoate hydroxymethyltransferase